MGGQNISDWSRDEFQSFVEEFGAVFIAFARRYTGELSSAQDIVQDCFCQLWIERGRRRAMAINNAPAFAMTMVKNRALNYVRSRGRFSDNLTLDTPLTDNFFTQLADNQHVVLLREALDTMPENWRQVMLMSLDGVAGKDIADRLGVTLDSVKAIKSRAAARLRKLLRHDLYSLCALLFMM